MNDDLVLDLLFIHRLWARGGEGLYVLALPHLCTYIHPADNVGKERTAAVAWFRFLIERMNQDCSNAARTSTRYTYSQRRTKENAEMYVLTPWF